MELYRFVSADGRSRALTGDRDGARLPPTVARWNYLGLQTVEDGRLGTPSQAIINAVESDGYFLIPAR